MWFPAHERHAIERVSITFQFSETLPTKLFQAILGQASTELPISGLDNAADELEANFMSPVVAGQPMMMPQSISVGPNGVVFGGQPLQVAGRTFRSIRDSVVKEEVQIHKNRLVYATSVYDGWANFIPRFRSLSDQFLNKYLASLDIESAKLEYWDRFTFRGDMTAANFADLFRQNSRYVPTFGQDMHELWHSHIGFFSDPGSSAKRLMNLNVDVIDVAEVDSETGATHERRSVGIYSMARDTFDDTKSLETIQEALSTMDEMHTILKDVLTNAITDQIADRISLNGQAAQ